MTNRIGLVLFLAAAFGQAASADLVDRGGGLIYDTERDITWLQDANYAETIGAAEKGKMTWHVAMQWVAGLRYYDPVRKRTWDDWRLPSARDASGGVPCFGLQCPDGELGHLFFDYGITEETPGPYRNFHPFSYWSETSRAPLPGAWLFHFGLTKQDFTGPFEDLVETFSWPVRDGDVGPATVAELLATPDVTGDGVAESALLRPGSVRVGVRDGDSGALLVDAAFFGPGFRPAGLLGLPDVNGNAGAEIAVLAVSDTGEVRLRVAEAATGTGIREFVFFSADHAPVDLAAITDISGNARADVALLVRRQSDGNNFVAVRDAVTGLHATGRNLRFFDPGFIPFALRAVPDQDSDGVDELAVFARRTSDGRIVAELRAADGAPGSQRSWFLPTGFTPIDAVLGDDADGNGIPELAVLAVRDSDGRIVVERRNVSGPPQTSRHWFFDTGWQAVQLAALADTTDPGSRPEYAVLAVRADGRAAVELRNAGSPANTLRRFYLDDGFDPLGLANFGDTNGNGEPDLGVAGTRRSDGRIRLDLRDARGNPNTRIRWFAP